VPPIFPGKAQKRPNNSIVHQFLGNGGDFFQKITIQTESLVLKVKAKLKECPKVAISVPTERASMACYLSIHNHRRRG
jgi:hypothetical protein